MMHGLTNLKLKKKTFLIVFMQVVHAVTTEYERVKPGIPYGIVK